MSKLDPYKSLKQVKARVDHSFSCCGDEISRGQIYYREHVADAFLHSLHAKKFCAACYETRADELLRKG